MNLLFTKAKKIDIIAWGLREPVSHVGILTDWGTVVHSVFSGVKEVTLDEFLLNREVVYNMQYIGKNTIEIPYYGRKLYDYMSFSYFIWRVILRRFLGKELPKYNKLDNPGAFLCTEWALWTLGEPTNQMLTPFDLAFKLYTSGEWAWVQHSTV